MRDLLDLRPYAIRFNDILFLTSFAGAFDIPVPSTGSKLRVVASAAFGWDHVSVSHRKRCPNWPEMARIKNLFFLDHECAMQLHVPADEHINNHPYCLHLWRPHRGEIPMPPAEFVGLRGKSFDEVKAMSAKERDAAARAAYAGLQGGGERA